MRKTTRPTPARRPAGRPVPVSVALALGTRLDRDSLAALLHTRPGVRVVGEARSGEEAAELCARKRPAVVIVETSFFWPAGPFRLADLLAAAPGTRVLALPPHDAPWCAVLNPLPGVDFPGGGVGGGRVDCLRLALGEGAHGVLRRSSSADELFQAIAALVRGESWVGPGVSLRDPLEPVLSAREREVARLVSEGASNQEIARALAISELTVKKHLSHLLRKLQLHDRLQLGLCVARHPLLLRARPRRPDPRGA